MNRNIYKIGFFVLLGINILLVVIFTLRPKMPMPQKGIKDEISLKLKLTSEQEAMFYEMAENHSKAMRNLEDQEKELVNSYFDQLLLDNLEGNKEDLLDQILELERNKFMVTYNHFEELKGICKKEQLAEFDKIIRRIIPVLTNTARRPEKPKSPPF